MYAQHGALNVNSSAALIEASRGLSAIFEFGFLIIIFLLYGIKPLHKPRFAKPFQQAYVVAPKVANWLFNYYAGNA